MNTADTYARALLRMVRAGKTPHQAVKTLAGHFAARGQAGMLPRLQQALARIGESEARVQPIIEVAHEEDATAARREVYVFFEDEKFAMRENKDLIGGWRAISKYILVDNSYKKHLADIYKRITL